MSLPIHTHIIFGEGKIAVEAGQIVKKDSEEFSGVSYVALYAAEFPGYAKDFPGYELGEDIAAKEPKRASQMEQVTWLKFKNAESIEVVEKALAAAKKYFEEEK